MRIKFKVQNEVYGDLTKMVKIGIMSDSHDNIDAIRRAVKVFNEEKVEAVFHAGDFIAPFVVPLALKDLKCDLYGVFGNNDGERIGLKAKLEAAGKKMEGDFLIITMGNRKIVMFHTLDEALVEALASQFDVIIRGHTHKAEIREIGNCMLVNPGETCGYLTDETTVAILDLNTLKATLIPI